MFFPNIAPVRILVAPADQDLRGSHTPTMAVSCVATGMPLPHITWQQNNYQITSNSFQMIREVNVVKNGLQLVTATLTVCPLHAAGGQYTCRAHNKYSSAEANFTVTTSGKAHSPDSKCETELLFCLYTVAVVEAPGSAVTQNVTIGERHELSCDFVGYPSPTVLWTFNGRPAAGAPFSTHSHDSGQRGQIIIRSHLSFTPHSVLFSGRYQCMAAENPLQAADFQLSVQGNQTPTSTSAIHLSICFLLPSL